MLAAAVFIAWGCGDQGIPDDVWEGSDADHEMRATYGRTDCAGQLPVEQLGLPSSLVETVGGDEFVYVPINPARPYPPLSAEQTEFRLKYWELWRWPERGSDQYNYLLFSEGGSPDPILYARVEPEECVEFG
jgi:hypothetical protein